MERNLPKWWKKRSVKKKRWHNDQKQTTLSTDYTSIACADMNSTDPFTDDFISSQQHYKCRKYRLTVAIFLIYKISSVTRIRITNTQTSLPQSFASHNRLNVFFCLDQSPHPTNWVVFHWLKTRLQTPKQARSEGGCNDGLEVWCDVPVSQTSNTLWLQKPFHSTMSV